MLQWLWKKFHTCYKFIFCGKCLKFSLTQGATKSPQDSLTDSVKVPTEIKKKSKVPDLPSKKKIVDNLNAMVPPDEPQRLQQTGNRTTIPINWVRSCSKGNHI